MRVLDLFSGITGFSVGLDRVGFQTVAFCEVDEHCRAFIAEAWPGRPIYEDVRILTAERLAEDGISINVICGGFPCQDVSVCGPRVGISGERSGLWSEFFRLIRELRPSYVIVENSAGLLVRGIDRVLGDLASIGYDAEWDVLYAADVGAPHKRPRVWLVAYPHEEGRPLVFDHIEWSGCTPRSEWPTTPLDTYGSAAAWLRGVSSRVSPFRRDADGLPHRVVEWGLGAYGNAVLPQIPEVLGRAILARHRRMGGG